MTKSEKLMILAVIVYMLNPLGVLALASPSTRMHQIRDLSSILARHKFQDPRTNEKFMHQNVAAHQKLNTNSNRSPASMSSKDYSCMRPLKE